MIGLFHTVPNQEYSHCAFTGKVLRWAKMMQREGWDCVEYSNGNSESGCNKIIQILSEVELKTFIGKDPVFHGDIATIGSPHHAEFEKRLLIALLNTVKDGDIICHPFGAAHSKVISLFPNNCYHIESGIGYPDQMESTFKIFESHAWRNFCYGKSNSSGKNFDFVIPNYFDLDDWNINLNPEGYIAYFGRICSVKGLNTVAEIANRINIPVIACGQGDTTPWKDSKIIFQPPITGTDRSKFLGNARAILAPTEYIEPLGGSNIEAALCGTPMISVDYGCFQETNPIEGVTGYRCKMLREWLESIEKCTNIDRTKVAEYARSKYSLEVCGKQYTAAFEQIMTLSERGWYTAC